MSRIARIASHCHGISARSRRITFERLEDRRMLSFSSGSDDVIASISVAPGVFQPATEVEHHL